MKMNDDPLEIFPDLILELVFQHFNCYEIKTCSQVSANWYETTGKSRKCMNKMTIDLNKYSPKIKLTVDVIHQSSRKYRHVWAVCYDKREKSEEVFQLLRKFQLSIATLTMYSLNLSDDFDDKPLVMPNLKSLSVLDLSPKACELIFSPNHEIEKFQYRPIMLKTFVPNVIKFLKSQSSLNELVLMRDLNFLLFKEMVNASTFPFALKRLSVQRKDHFDFVDSDKTLKNFENFLIAQNNSMKIIEIDYVPSHSLIETIVNNMNVLENVKIRSGLKNEKLLLIKKNSSIISLNLNQFPVETVKQILVATTHLQTLTLPRMELTKALLEFIVMNVKTLKKLFYDDIEASCILYYNELKMSTNNINKDVELIWLLAS